MTRLAVVWGSVWVELTVSRILWNVASLVFPIAGTWDNVEFRAREQSGRRDCGSSDVSGITTF